MHGFLFLFRISLQSVDVLTSQCCTTSGAQRGLAGQAELRSPAELIGAFGPPRSARVLKGWCQTDRGFRDGFVMVWVSVTEGFMDVVFIQVPRLLAMPHEVDSGHQSTSRRHSRVRHSSAAFL